jgi:hypothetical protein
MEPVVTAGKFVATSCGVSLTLTLIVMKAHTAAAAMNVDVYNDDFNGGTRRQ